MIRTVVVFVFAVLLLGACRTAFNGDPPTDAESETSSSGDTESDSTSEGTGEEETGDETTGMPEPDVPDDGTDETGGDEPEPAAAWLFDGDLSEEVMGAHATAFGSVDFEDTPAGQGARLVQSSYIDASAMGPLAFASREEFSVLVTYYQDDDFGTQILWSLGRSTDEGAPDSNAFFLGLTDGTVQAFTETGLGENHYLDLDPGPAFGQWATLVFVINGDEIRVFWGGELRASGFLTPVETATQELYFGSVRDDVTPLTTNVLDGLLEEIRFYDYALTNDEAVALAE